MKYNIYYKKKPNGGFRKICAPDNETKQKQRELLRSYQEQIGKEHKTAYGFVKNKNVKDNALIHIGREAIYNIDLKDFFDSINREMLLTYCKKNNLSEDLLKDIDTFVLPKEKHLPQGAPSSPFLANIYCRPLDKKLYTLAKKNKIMYTRYADDITFSGKREDILKIKNDIKNIIYSYSLKINKKKETLYYKTNRKFVTGVNVSDHLSISRKQYNKFRADIYRTNKAIENNEITYENHNLVLGEDISKFEARVNYIVYINPNLIKLKIDAEKLRKKIVSLKKIHGG